MIDPVGAFENVRENFILYVKTAFATRFDGLESERERLLRQSRVFCQEPWIEPMPRYEGSGKTIQDLGLQDVPGLDAAALQDFKDLGSLRLAGGYELHRHQCEMLRMALSGRNCVVTAGTGSGKTEAFLLPLFAYLVNESRSRWGAPGNPLPHWNDWWRNDAWQNQCYRHAGKQRRMQRSLRVTQRGHEQRRPAVRALILYPMNALVEDQLTRLRKALDAPEVRDWFRDHRSGNRIYFGRYNSATPVPGHEYRRPTAQGHQNPDSDKVEALAEGLKGIERSACAAAERAAQTGDQSALFFFPRLDGAEMRCRWDMQDAPPDILITNYSMLSVMLMRDADRGIFEKTAAWLREEGSVFHLIIDELHLYRGTAGTEVAYLLRLLLLRLGLTPASPKLRILASSASLERDPESLEESLSFLSQFFGVDWSEEQIIPGYPRPVPPVTGTPALPRPAFAALAAAPPGGPVTLRRALRLLPLSTLRPRASPPKRSCGRRWKHPGPSSQVACSLPAPSGRVRGKRSGLCRSPTSLPACSARNRRTRLARRPGVCSLLAASAIGRTQPPRSPPSACTGSSATWRGCGPAPCPVASARSASRRMAGRREDFLEWAASSAGNPQTRSQSTASSNCCTANTAARPSSAAAATSCRRTTAGSC